MPTEPITPEDLPDAMTQPQANAHQPCNACRCCGESISWFAVAHFDRELDGYVCGQCQGRLIVAKRELWNQGIRGCRNVPTRQRWRE